MRLGGRDGDGDGGGGRNSTRGWCGGGRCTAGETGFGGEEGGDAVEDFVGYDALLEKGF